MHDTKNGSPLVKLQRYPWGDTPPAEDCALANYGGGCTGRYTDVGSFPDGASPYGALDMIGNVFEIAIPWDVVTNPDDRELWRGGAAAGSLFQGPLNAQASSRYIVQSLGTSRHRLSMCAVAPLGSAVSAAQVRTAAR